MARAGCSEARLAGGTGHPAGGGAARAAVPRAPATTTTARRPRCRRARHGTWWRPRSWARSTSPSCSASSAAVTTSSRRWCACHGPQRALDRRHHLGPHADARRRRGGGAGPHVVTAADVVVVGAGCAGLSAACRPGRGRRARRWSSEARPVLGGRTFATRDPGQRRVGRQRPARAARLLSRDAGVPARASAPRGLRERAGGAARCRWWTAPAGGASCAARRCRRRCNLVAGVLGVVGALVARTAVGAGPGHALCRGTRPAPRRPDRAPVAGGAWSGGRLVRAAVGAAGGGRAQPAASTPPPPTTFVEVVRRMLGPGPDDAALVLPHGLADAHVRRPGRGVRRAPRRHRPAGQHRSRSRSAPAAPSGSTLKGERVQAAAVVSAVPWHALAGLCGDAAPAELAPVVAGATAMRSSPIVTANLWFDRPVLDTPFVGLPGRAFQWAFDRRRVTPGEATYVSLVCSGADRRRRPAPTTRSSLAPTRELPARPAGRRAVRDCVRGTAVRERRATFSLAAGEPARPGHGHRPCPASSSPATGPTPACPPPSRAPSSAATAPPAPCSTTLGSAAG